MEEACRGSVATLHEVLALLSYHEQSGDLGPLDLLDIGARSEGETLTTIGPYRVIDVLGEGGTGVVYLAERGEACAVAPDADRDQVEASPQRVALKVLRPAFLSGDAALERFARESRMLQQLEHPGIVRLLDSGFVGADPAPAGTRRTDGATRGTASPGTPYIALEWIDGVTLRRWCQDTTPSIDARLRAIAEVADAIAHAHAAGVIHRDLKPENILIDRSGRARVLDFGLARPIENDGHASITETKQIIGTVRYMSPEQVYKGGRGTDARTDVYSLGVVLYELLTGVLPYDLDDKPFTQSLLAIATDPIIPASEREPQFEGDIDFVLLKALAKGPADRYTTAEAFASDLRHVLRGARPTVRPSARAKLSCLVQHVFRLRPSEDPARRLAIPRRALRRAVVASRVLLGIAAATLIGGLGPGLLNRIRAGSENSAATERKLNLLYRHLEQIDRDRHLPSLDRAGIVSCIDELRKAEQELAAIPQQPFSPELGAYILWRRGELHYFLGNEDLDPREYEIARACWHDMRNTLLHATALAKMRNAETLKAAIERLGMQRWHQGEALAYQAIAFHRAPLPNLLEAVQARRNALSMLVDPTGSPFPIEPERRPEYADYVALEVGSARRDFAAALVELGVVADSLPVLREAFDQLALAEASVHFRADKGARNGLLLIRSRAWLASYDLTGRGADLDSARATGLRSLRLSRDSVTPARRAAALAEIAQADYLASRSAPGEPTARPPEAAASIRLGQISRARDEMNEALADFPRDDPRAFAMLLIEAAPIHMDLAALGSDPEANFATADSLLNAASDALPKEKFPARQADILRERAQLLRVRWQLTGNDTFRSDARRLLRESEVLLPRSDSPHHIRLVGQGRRALDPI